MAKRRRRSNSTENGIGEKVKTDKRRSDDSDKKSGKSRAERRKQYQRRRDLVLLGSMALIIIIIISSYFAYALYIYPTYINDNDNGNPNDFYVPPTDHNNPGNGGNIYSFDTPQPMNPSDTIVIMEVENYGSMVIELYDSKAPITVANFVKYVEDGFYDGLIFHRIVNSESMKVIQGGGYYPNGNPKTPSYDPIQLEIDPTLLHVDGAIAMARTSDPNSATSQFYICIGDGLNQHLDGEYAVFGQVIDGNEIYKTINNVQLEGEKPVNDVIIKSAYVYLGV